MTRFLVFICALLVIGAAYADDIICDAGQYFNGTECTACPSAHPNSDPGATARSNCYSNIKTRDCSASCVKPNGCNDVKCNFTSCDYVTYAKDSGLGNSAIKWGCESCDDVVVESVSALPGHRVNGLSCEICPAGTYSAGGDATMCDSCPTGAKTNAGAVSRDECARVLNYLPKGETNPTKILLKLKKNTSPALAVKIKDDVFYGDMTRVNDTSKRGLYIGYNDENYIVGQTSLFYITTTNDTGEFQFYMAAIGNFTVDWGDGAIESIVRTNTTRETYSHTYDTPGEYTIGFSGRATGYNSACYTKVGLRKVYNSVISFSGNSNIAKIGGSLGEIFPTIDGNNPCFYQTFYNNTNLSGEIPVGLFGNLYGTPHSCMFQSTFYGCTNLTGPMAQNPDGTPLYDIEYNGQRWIDAYPDSFTDMYTNSGVSD